jgi:hypothetical protein
MKKWNFWYQEFDFLISKITLTIVSNGKYTIISLVLPNNGIIDDKKPRSELLISRNLDFDIKNWD